MKTNMEFYSKQLGSFLKGNNVVLVALGGAAVGLAIARLLQTERGRQVLHFVEENIKDFSADVINRLVNRTESKVEEPA